MVSPSQTVSPLQNLHDALDSDLDCPQASQALGRKHEHAIVEHRPDEAASDDDLARLERSLQWLKRERAALEAGLHGQNQRRGLPRAGRLPPPSGVPPVNTEHARQKRETLTFLLAPPLASERLPLSVAKRRRPYNLPGALGILVASVVAGSIAYHILMGGLFSALEPAQAASLQAR